MKKQNDKIKKMLGDNSNSFVDKLASIKYITKKDSKFLSSVVSGVLKKMYTEIDNEVNHCFPQLLVHLNHHM